MKLKFWQKSKDEELKGASFWQRIWLYRARLLYFIGGIAALVGGYILAQYWQGHRESVLLTMAVILLFVGGVILLIKGWRVTRYEEAVIVGAKKPEGPVNSLNIYAKKDAGTGQLYPEKIAFELVNSKGQVVTETTPLEKGEHPIGQPWQSLDNGQWYHLNIWDIAAGKLKPFMLPDSQYFDPREFANVITMPAHKKLFERRATLFQKIAPWIMLVGFIASGFFLIVAGGE